MITVGATSILKIETDYDLVHDLFDLHVFTGERHKYDPKYPYGTAECMIRLVIRSEDARAIAQRLKDVSELVESFANRMEDKEKEAEELSLT